ncbi:tryptophan-rich antigen [Plasmodium cynomolgi strain B]|uniref:Tryptophan-rich antigen n=1 Tax=Plasmodium cynomolgi (strain B) TaxID=1120755 RepID=K6UCS5_PLACD|nr:tryptophan-rich antigen [Plasmodium cynomolgi strain B]GAB65361.1 tryptophan-rich antigen [Plasmodium cynomolgi strain B]
MVSSVSIAVLLLSSALLNNSLVDAAQKSAAKPKGAVATKAAKAKGPAAKAASAKKPAATKKPAGDKADPPKKQGTPASPAASASQGGKKPKAAAIITATKPNEYVEEWRVKPLEWKLNEFSKWLKKAEEDWKDFHVVLEDERTKWVENMGDIEKGWFENAEKKWSNYNQRLDMEYKSNILKKAKEWKEAQWKEWINKSLKKYITNDFQKWMDGHQNNLNAAVGLNWETWKKQKMFECNSIGWRLKEDKHWIRWTFFSPNIDDIPVPKEYKELYENWKIRTKAEKDQWKEWTDRIESRVIFKDTPAWTKWKNEKTAAFNKWLVAFTNNLIAQKKWTKWV